MDICICIYIYVHTHMCVCVCFDFLICGFKVLLLKTPDPGVDLNSSGVYPDDFLVTLIDF